jgi:hypothetical protein
MHTSPVACPSCGKLPTMHRYRASFWRLVCDHMTPVTGHPMRTQREAIEAWNVERITDAVRKAMHAIRADVLSFPQAPAGWPDRAQSALESQTPGTILMAGLELRSAHSQYRADFDCMPALYELRLAIPHPVRTYVSSGVPVCSLRQEVDSSPPNPEPSA